MLRVEVSVEVGLKGYLEVSLYTTQFYSLIISSQTVSDGAANVYEFRPYLRIVLPCLGPAKHQH